MSWTIPHRLRHATGCLPLYLDANLPSYWSDRIGIRHRATEALVVASAPIAGKRTHQDLGRMVLMLARLMALPVDWRKVSQPLSDELEGWLFIINRDKGAGPREV